MLSIMLPALLIIIGACLGSFFNMLIHRLPREEDIVFKPSHCPKCTQKLSVFNLIPILSYCWQLGKCSKCKQVISWRYISVELLSAGLFLGCFYQLGFGLLFWQYTLFLSLFILCFFCDLETKLLPNSLTYGMLIAGLIFAYFTNQLIPNLWAILYCTGGFILLERLSYLYYKQPTFGWGDIKLCAGIASFSEKAISPLDPLSFLAPSLPCATAKIF
jgi:leader peptidase (prepilin peptidase) / N-methyltransferase